MSTHIHTHSYMSEQYTYPHAHTHTQSYTFICPLNILDRVCRYIEMRRRRRNLAPIRKPLAAAPTWVRKPGSGPAGLQVYF